MLATVPERVMVCVGICLVSCAQLGRQRAKTSPDAVKIVCTRIHLSLSSWSMPRVKKVSWGATLCGAENHLRVDRIMQSANSQRITAVRLWWHGLDDELAMAVTTSIPEPCGCTGTPTASHNPLSSVKMSRAIRNLRQLGATQRGGFASISTGRPSLSASLGLLMGDEPRVVRSKGTETIRIPRGRSGSICPMIIPPSGMRPS